MKTISLFFATALLLVNFDLNAQDEFSQIADETCDCLEEYLPKGDYSKLQVKAIFELCVIESAENHSAFVTHVLGNKMTEKEDVENVMVYINNQFIENCEIIGEIQKTLDEKESGDEAAPAPVEALAGYSGIVTAVQGEDVLVLKIRIDGTVQTFHFLRNFAGREIARQRQSLVGKSVYVEYRNSELYAPKEGAVVEVKEITRIDLN